MHETVQETFTLGIHVQTLSVEPRKWTKTASVLEVQNGTQNGAPDHKQIKLRLTERPPFWRPFPKTGAVLLAKFCQRAKNGTSFDLFCRYRKKFHADLVSMVLQRYSLGAASAPLDPSITMRGAASALGVALGVQVVEAR